jgi:hypothetical protein
MAYERLNLRDGDILKEEHLVHIEDALYDLSIGNGGTEKKVRLCLPDVIRWEANKPLYIFKHAITTAFNYQVFNIQVLMSANETKGKDRNRYFTYTPTEAETNTLTFNLYDNAQNLIDTKNVTLKVVLPTKPSNPTKLLFIGDSLVYYNRITDEFYRVMHSSDSETTVKDSISIYNIYKPSGRNASNVGLIGTQKQNYKGWTGQTYHEGRSGWGWQNFNSSSSPFYSSSAKGLDFNAYLSKNSFATPDVVYIGLGWNDTRDLVISDTNPIDTSSLRVQVKSFLDKLTSQLPNTKIRLWTQNVPGIHGGIGNHVYGATHWVDEHRLKLMMLSIAEMYNELAKSYQNVEVVWTTCMIDSEYALQESESAINYRIADKEVLGIDYVHPADAGFFQIADGIIADYMHCIEGGESGDVNYDDVPATAITHYQSGVGNAVMYYQDVFKYMNNTTLSGWGSTIVMADVSAYVGKRIKITAATSVQSGAFYAMFVSKLPTGLDSLTNLPSFNASNYEEDKTDMLEYFNISNVDKTTRSIVVTVPQGAVYIAFENLSNYCQTPFVGLVTE